MARLYANENFPLPAVEELRRLGHDVLTTSEAGTAGQALSDDEVLDFAVGEKRTLVTLNRRHCVRIYQQRSTHEGIIVCTVDNDFTSLAARSSRDTRCRYAGEPTHTRQQAGSVNT
ncbi:MAG: DUF5615 family PIN-like protein [Planctomycetota bacterium]